MWAGAIRVSLATGWPSAKIETHDVWSARIRSVNACGGFGSTTCECGFATGELTSVLAETATEVLAGATGLGERFALFDVDTADADLAGAGVGDGLVDAGAGSVIAGGLLSREPTADVIAAGCAAAEVWCCRRKVQKANIRVISNNAAASFPQGTG